MRDKIAKGSFAEQIAQARILSEFLAEKHELNKPGGEYYKATRSMLKIRNSVENEPCSSTGSIELSDKLVKDFAHYEQCPEDMSDEIKSYIINTINGKLRRISETEPDKYDKISLFGTENVPSDNQNDGKDMSFYRDIIYDLSVEIFGYFGEKITK